MAPRSRSSASGRARTAWWTVALVLLLIVVVLLSAAAVWASRSSTPGRSVRPAPSFQVSVGGSSGAASSSLGGSASVSSTGSASASGVAEDSNSASFVVALSDSTVWRAQSGRCVPGAASATSPSVEVSTDGGASWTDVTPTDSSVREVLGLGSINSSAVFAVVASGSSCEVEVLRSFTAGVSWSASDAALASVSYVNPSNRASVVVSGTSVAAPCADPSRVDFSSTEVAVLCDGAVYTRALSGSTWDAASLSSVLGFVYTDDGFVYAQSGVAGCEGVSVSRATTPTGGDGVALACVADASEAVSGVGVFASADNVFVWNGASWRTEAAS